MNTRRAFFEKRRPGTLFSVDNRVSVTAAVYFSPLEISSVVGIIALPRCSSIQHISFASLFRGFIPLLMTTHSAVL